MIVDSNGNRICEACGGRMRKVRNSYDTYRCVDCEEESSNITGYYDGDKYEDIYGEDDMPECCAACGGPYPNCIDSCDIMDD